MNTGRAFACGCISVGLLVAIGAACSSSKGGSAIQDGGTQEAGETGDAGPGFGDMPIAGQDVDPPADVKLNPDVVIVHGGASVLQSVSTDHGTWTLSKSAAGVSKLAVGKILLIAGLDVARVTGLKDSGSSVEVTVAPVAITDVIQEANLTWNDVTLDPTRGIAIQGPWEYEAETYDQDAGASDGGAEAGLSGDAAAIDAGAKVVHGLPRPRDRQFSMTIGQWKVTFSGTQSGSGADIKVAGTFSKNSSVGTGVVANLGSISGELDVEALIKTLKVSSGSLAVSGSQLSSSSFSLPMEGSIKVSTSATAQAGSQFPKMAVVKVPATVEYPFVCWAGIPCYLSFQVSLALQPSLATVNAGYQMSMEFDYSGASGFSFSKSSATTLGSPTATTPTDPLQKLVTSPSEGATALVAAVQAPRVGLGVGTLSFLIGAKAGLFVDVINSFGFVVAPATSLVPCQQIDWTFSANGGAEATFSILNAAKITPSSSVSLASASQNWYTPHTSACKP